MQWGLSWAAGPRRRTVSLWRKWGGTVCGAQSSGWRVWDEQRAGSRQWGEDYSSLGVSTAVQHQLRLEKRLGGWVGRWWWLWCWCCGWWWTMSRRGGTTMERGGGRDDLIPVKSNEVILPDSYSLSWQQRSHSLHHSARRCGKERDSERKRESMLVCACGERWGSSCMAASVLG